MNLDDTVNGEDKDADMSTEPPNVPLSRLSELLDDVLDAADARIGRLASLVERMREYPECVQPATVTACKEWLVKRLMDGADPETVAKGADVLHSIRRA